MKLEKYCVVCLFDDSTEDIATMTLEMARSKLRERGICFTPPKIGNHVTILPPFYAHEDEARILASGLEFAQHATTSNSEKLLAKYFREQWKFFTDKKGDALVFNLSVSDKLGFFVESWRRQFIKTNNWVFPIKNYFFLPHLTIGEGLNFHRAFELSQLDNWFNKIGGFGFHLSVPVVMKKNEKQKQWNRVSFHLK